MLPKRGYYYLCVDDSIEDKLDDDKKVKAGENKLYTMGKIYLSPKDNFLKTDISQKPESFEVENSIDCCWTIEERFTRMFRKISGNKRKSKNYA